MATVREEWGLQCPQCGRDDKLNIAMLVWGRLYADGTDTSVPDDSSHTWNDQSDCQCAACGFESRVVAFSVGKGE